MTDGMSCVLDLFAPDAGGDDRAPASDEALLQATVEACYRRAEIHFRRRFERPRLTLDLRGMAAAVAHTHRNVIRFNRRLFERNTADFLRHTVPHEVSHLLACRLHGRGIAPHGDKWAAIMHEVFGLAPTRCHPYDVRPDMTAAYRYRCGCDAGHVFGTRRHNSARRGRRYYCRRCRQPLAFVHREEPAAG